MKQKFWIFLLFIAISIGIALLIYFLSHNKSSPFSSNSNPHSSKFQYKECSIKEPYNHPRLIKNVITPQEANEIIKWAKPHLGDAEVITYSRKDLKHRNNKVAWLPKSHHLSKKIINKVAQATNMPVKNFEDVQVCYYAPGNFFKYHQDQCHDRGELCRKETDGRGGTRVYNLLLYLNNNFTGGETEFPKLNKKYKLPPGDGVLWDMLNVDQNQVHPLAEHAGLTVKNGKKWICNVWVRSGTFV